MRRPQFFFGSSATRLVAASLLTFIGALNVADCHGANFGIHFGGDGGRWGGWGPYYLNQVGAHGAGPYASAFGVPAANWYEPGAFSHTTNLPGNPTSVNFQPASMGAGSVNFSWSAAAPATGTQNGYTFIPYGFSNANRYVMEVDGSGNPVLDGDGHYVPVVPNQFAPDNGVPKSGEHAVLAGALFATDGVEYAPNWPQGDIVVKITGMASIASSYKVKLLAAVQNGNVVEAFTPGTVTDNASNSEVIQFELLPDRPSYWSPFDPDPTNPYVSVGGVATGTTTFTGDSLEIRLTGPNEYFNDEFEFARTVLAGVIVEYNATNPVNLPGDYDHSGAVQLADHTKWRQQFGTAGPDADGNLNNTVDAADYVIWRQHYTGSASAAAAAVPEPTGLLLAFSCVAMFAGFVRGRAR
jgi:hypothetical protein